MVTLWTCKHKKVHIKVEWEIVKRLGLGTGTGDWDWGLGLGTGIGDWDWGLGLGVGEWGICNGKWEIENIPVPGDDSIISQATHPPTTLP